MNDQIKLLVAGAVIGIVGAVVGAVVVAMAMKSETRQAVSTQPSAFSAQKLAVSGQRPVNFSPSVFPAGGTNVRLGPIRGTNIHLLTSVATNGSKRFLTSPPTGGMSLSAIQSVQNVPEVKQAREAAAEAQRRYFEVMKKAAEGKK